MNNEGEINSIILVVEDINETRDGIEKLLKADGYRVTLARDEKDAIESARREPPNLILVSVAGLPHDVVIAARHGLAWYEIDINWWGIRVMQFLGLARAIKLVNLAHRFLA